MLWGAALLAFLVSLAVLRLLLTRFARLALDQPNERSLHDRPVPRTGVIYVMARAQERGFHYGHPGWANLGQGAPQAGEIPGSGLGLLITKRCVELHGGSIGFVSAPGEGTAFTVRLPVFAGLP